MILMEEIHKLTPSGNPAWLAIKSETTYATKNDVDEDRVFVVVSTALEKDPVEVTTSISKEAIIVPVSKRGTCFESCCCCNICSHRPKRLLVFVSVNTKLLTLSTDIPSVAARALFNDNLT